MAFETAIEINPELGAGYNNLGYVLYLQENFEAAIEMYNEAIGREHDTSAAYTNLGNAWQKMDKTEKAVESWKLALEVDPSNERAQSLPRPVRGTGRLTSRLRSIRSRAGVQQCALARFRSVGGGTRPR